MKNQKLVSFRASEVEVELQSNMIAVSDNKAIAMQKNMKNRLKACKAFVNASESSLDLIVTHSSASMLEYLMNASNYKTATRVLDCAKYMCNEKHSSIIDYTLSALERSVLQKTSVDQVCNISQQCYARISNAVKALAFFDLIKVENAMFNDRLIVKLSKDSLISLNTK
ncbi:MAG: hypothetical protein ACXWT0_01805 [Methylobacter sp.]